MKTIDVTLIGVPVLTEPVNHKGFHASRMWLEFPSDPEVTDILPTQRESGGITALVVCELASFGMQSSHMLQLSIPLDQWHLGGSLIAGHIAAGDLVPHQIVHVQQQLSPPIAHVQQLGIWPTVGTKAAVVAAGRVPHLQHMAAIEDLAQRWVTVVCRCQTICCSKLHQH